MAVEESVLRVIEGMLTEEKWTRKALNEYTVADLEELDSHRVKILEEAKEEEVLELCSHYQSNTREGSIAALYLIGTLSLSKQRFNDAPLLKLVMLFRQNNRWSLAAYTAYKVLEFGENRVALRFLVDFYEHEQQEKQRFEIIKRLLRVDYEEIDFATEIAEKLESDGKESEALEFYHKAFYRCLSLNRLTKLETLWQHLIELEPQNLDFFWQAWRKISRNNLETGLELLRQLYPVCQEQNMWKEALQVIKWVLEMDPTSHQDRLQIVKCYREIYKEHSQVETYIRLSNLEQGWRNVIDAIVDFEKHVSFDANSFVYHNSWGVGRIRSIKNDNIIIDFAKKRNHQMVLQMAINALQSIGKNHIWVLKSVVPLAKLREQVKGNVLWTLKIIIRSFDNHASVKEIKAELVPQILSEKEWSAWGQEARQMLRHESCFGAHPEKADVFVVQDTPVSLPQKLYNQFQSEDDFFKRLQIAEEYLTNCEIESDYFNEMFQYFSGALKSQNVTETLISAFLYVDHIHHEYPFLNVETDWTFAALYRLLDRPGETLTKINNLRLKKDFVLQVRKHIDNWQSELMKLFAYTPMNLIIELLDEEKEYACIAEIVENLFNRFRELRTSFLWLVNNALQQDWFSRLEIPEERIWVTVLRLLDLSARDIENRRDLQLNRKVHKGLINILFKEKKLENFMLQTDKETMSRIMQLLTSVKGLNNYEDNIRGLRQEITAKFDVLDFHSSPKSIEKTAANNQRVWVTESFLSRKKQDLRHLLEVEVPHNSAEIGRAIEMGDLSENAEYKEARERQENLNIQVGKLRDEIERAQIFNEAHVDASKISFGTRVRLLPTERGEEEVFTILGPWESNPDEGVLSYLSPFGAAILNAKKGENLKFEINDRHFDYLVVDIRSAFDTIDAE